MIIIILHYRHIHILVIPHSLYPIYILRKFLVCNKIIREYTFFRHVLPFGRHSCIHRSRENPRKKTSWINIYSVCGSDLYFFFTTHTHYVYKYRFHWTKRNIYRSIGRIGLCMYIRNICICNIRNDCPKCIQSIDDWVWFVKMPFLWYTSCLQHTHPSNEERQRDREYYDRGWIGVESTVWGEGVAKCIQAIRTCRHSINKRILLILLWLFLSIERLFWPISLSIKCVCSIQWPAMSIWRHSNGSGGKLGTKASIRFGFSADTRKKDVTKRERERDETQWAIHAIFLLCWNSKWNKWANINPNSVA